MKKYTAVVRHGTSKDNKIVDVLGYTLITPEYTTVTLSVDKIKEALKEKKAEISNLGLNEAGEIIGTNGALDKYTFVDVNTLLPVGKTKAVVLNRAEKDGKLIGYTIWTADGTLAEANVADVVKLAQANCIANGKIRHTATGDIVSSIKGEYEIRQIKMNEAPKGKISVDVCLFRHIVGVGDFFAGIIYSTSAAELAALGNKLRASNAKVVVEIGKLLGNKEKEAAKIQRYGANGIYGLFNLKDLDSLVKLDGTLISKLMNGEILVECISVNTEEQSIENQVVEKVGTNFKVKKLINADEKLVSTADKFVAKLGEKYTVTRKKS